MSLRFLIGLVLAVAACRGSDEKSSATETKSAPAEGAMCEEHGVLEAICTKCNPKLIPVFKAKGDWCEEHGFPMSVCPIHHPERGGKPATKIAAEKAPADGTKVRLKTQDTARLAGIKTVKAVPRPGGQRLEALATITYDATKWAQVNARAAGVVREIKVDVGATVKAGTPIAVIESATVGADRSRLTAARSRLAFAETTYNREVELNKKGISAQKDVLEAQQELDAARAEVTAATAAVGVVGGGGGSGYVITAPIAGIVTKRNITIGNMVAADDRVLFEIVDTRMMRAEIEVPEADLVRVHVGQDVAVIVDALPDVEVLGKIDYLAPDISRETRTVKARATLVNPDGALRANMFGRARISLGDSAQSVVVPRAAVQRVAEVDLVFVKVAEGEYDTRRVKTGAREGDTVEVSQGIKPDEDVVTEGSFLLKTETLKGAIGAGCCE
jgi:cobalt-zinc-cadmium efflux system membrane fusion protein